MLFLTNSELEIMCKKPQTRKITTKCQKNREAGSIISKGKRHSKVEGTRQNQTFVLWVCLFSSFYFFLLASQFLY